MCLNTECVSDLLAQFTWDPVVQLLSPFCSQAGFLFLLSQLVGFTWWLLGKGMARSKLLSEKFSQKMLSTVSFMDSSDLLEGHSDMVKKPYMLCGCKIGFLDISGKSNYL